MSENCSGETVKIVIFMVRTTYQEEHSLLIAFPGQLLKTALPDELSVVLDEVFIAHEVTLELHQFDKVFRLFEFV